MQDEIANNMAQGLQNRAARRPGRPKQSERKPAQPREIIHDDGKIQIERCTYCGKSVRMEVYSVKDNVRYCRCPGCGKHHALTKTTIRRIN